MRFWCLGSVKILVQLAHAKNFLNSAPHPLGFRSDEG